MNEQLPVTTWPGVPVPMPGLLRYPGATIDGEIIWIPNWGAVVGDGAAAA